MTAAAPPPQDAVYSVVIVQLPSEDWRVVDVRIQHETPAGVLLMPQVAPFHDPSVEEVLRIFSNACEDPNWQFQVGIPAPDPKRKGKMLRGWLPIGPGSPLQLRVVPRPPPPASQPPQLIVTPGGG